jgi:hypothetical protein
VSGAGEKQNKGDDIADQPTAILKPCQKRAGREAKARYRMFGKSQAAYRWTDIETFCVVTHRVPGFIKTSESLGWHFSRQYKHYKKLAIPRALFRAVGMSDAIVKTPGYNPSELASLMNECVVTARARTARESQ